MAKKLITEEFIDKAKLVHGDRYDYSLVEYTGYDKKIKVICSVHGEFETQARCHLKADCSKCSANKRTTTFEEFIKKANEVHNSIYLYDEKSYINTNEKINIFCKTHGWFRQVVNGHLSGKRCVKCMDELKGKSQKFSQEDFINKAILLHGKKYNYDKTVYKNSSTKIIIWCNKCNKYFNQISSLHLRHGCKTCSDKNNGLNLRKTNEQYISDVNKVHNNFYSYINTKYNKIGDKITVTCYLHGDFLIRASDHISGCGCIPCSLENKKYNGWTHSLWEEFGNKSKNFIAFQVYLIKCSSLETNEIFYKIGKTYIELKYRFSGKRMPYNYEILKIIEGDGREISILEKKLHTKYKEFKYKPKKEFGGFLECFTGDLPIQEIIKI